MRPQLKWLRGKCQALARAPCFAGIILRLHVSIFTRHFSLHHDRKTSHPHHQRRRHFIERIALRRRGVRSAGGGIDLCADRSAIGYWPIDAAYFRRPYLSAGYSDQRARDDGVCRRRHTRAGGAARNVRDCRSAGGPRRVRHQLRRESGRRYHGFGHSRRDAGVRFVQGTIHCHLAGNCPKNTITASRTRSIFRWPRTFCASLRDACWSRACRRTPAS